MSVFFDAMTRMALVTDAQMALPWKWRGDGEVLEVRDAFHRSLEAEYAQATAVRDVPLEETSSADLLAQRAAGDLCGLLAGLPDDVLGRQPAAGEWPLRETMRHVIETEAHFRIKTLWAIDRRAEDPIHPPGELQPSAADLSGDAASWIAMLLQQRATTDAEFVRVSSDGPVKPSTLSRPPGDPRFRLHPPASH